MSKKVLLEFRVKNYRSFRNESALSLVAGSDKTLEQRNTVSTGLSTISRAVRSAVIYGANASGKSNLVRALHMMRSIIIESASLQPNQLFNVQPFRLDEGSLREPTLFEITILLDGTRYQYGFELSPERIKSEWLLVYQKSKPQRWFDRKMTKDGSKDVYEFGSHLTGPKRIWQDATRPNALFLSTAVQLNSEVLAPLYRWFAEDLVVFLDGGQLAMDFSTQMLQTPQGNAQLVGLMQAADFAITSISTQRKKGLVHQFKLEPNGITDAKVEENDLLVPQFKHTVGSVSADFEFFDESQGTQKMFSLAGPLLDILRRGCVVIIDELDRSLHPNLVRQIIETFQNPELNPHGSQLIFTTHDTSQLDNALLRRDQVWFTEKPFAAQSSELIPLNDFSPRKGEALERNYLSGRYGGVPILAERLVEDERAKK